MPELNEKERIEWSLFAMRAGVFIVMAIWTLDKFFNPGHSSGVFQYFYYIDKDFAASIMFFLALVETVLVISFVLGFKKRITYGLVLAFHTISTLSSWKMYIEPFGSPNIFFWAAWPMLAACIALYLLRDLDNKLTIQST